MRKFNFRAWEILLIVFSLLFFFASLGLYIANIPIRGYLLGMQEEDMQTQVGVLGSASGEVKRQLMSDSEFTSIAPSAPLYNQDTIVTGPGSGAQLLLEDGSTIDLSPNTMVKLAFESRLSLGGISRGATVNVVTGAVTGVAKAAPIKIRSRREVVTLATHMKRTIKAPPAPVVAPALSPAPSASPSPAASPPVPVEPSPSPKPTSGVTAKLEMLSPRPQEKVSVDRGSRKPEKRVEFEWKLVESAASEPIGKVRITLLLVKRFGGPAERNQVAQQVVALQGGRGRFSVVLKKAGLYEWRLSDERGEALPVEAKTSMGQFTLSPAYEGIEVLDPLVGGQSGASNALKGQLLKSFDVTLRWKPYEGASGKYRIRFSGTADFKKVLMAKETEGESYRFNKDRIFTGQVFYQVLVQHRSGFTVVSAPQKFTFTFLPPALVVPEDKTVLKASTLKGDDNTILFTWQKTNFTEKYHFQIGLDPDFKTVYIKLVVKENFFILKAPKPGKYWWRVKSLSKTAESGFSRGNSLEIQP